MTNGIIDSGQEIVTNGLVLHLDAAQRRSYSGSGTVWTDLSGNSNNGTLTNGPTFNSANGGTIQLDGSNDHVNMGDILNNVFAGTNPKYSFNVWVMFNTLAVNTNYTIFNKSGDGSFSENQRLLTLVVRNLTANNYNGFQVELLTFFDNNAANFRAVRTLNANLKTNTLYNIQITFDGTVNTNDGLDRVKIYINGQLQSTTIIFSSGTLSNTFQNSTARLCFGAAIGTNPTNTPVALLNGTVYNASIYNRALSQTEVLQNYNATKSRFEVPALLDLYPNAAAAYSLRKLRSGYTGSAIRVRRSSDNTEQDIGFTSTGDLDTTALTTFVGANNGFVSTWYDQSGNNRNATQTTQANQPIVVSGGTVYRDVNGKVWIKGYENLNTNLTSQVFTTIPQPYTTYTVLSYLSFTIPTTTPYAIDLKSIDTIIGAGYFNNHRTYAGITLNNTFPGIIEKTYLYSVIFNTTNSLFSVNNNTVNGDIGTRSADKITIFNARGFNAALNGYLQEFIFYPTNQSPNRIGIETNINSYYGIYNPTVVTMDTDAQAFITAASITDLVQQGAINTLVKTLKDVNLWSKMKAIYPFVGGTAASHKFNLKDPRDVDGAFRLVFSGGWTHSSTGALPNGTTGWANTYFNPSSVLTVDSTHMSIYSNTNDAVLAGSTDPVDMGSYNSATQSITLVNSVLTAITRNLGAVINWTQSTRLGLVVTNKTASNITKIHKNGVVVASGSSVGTLPTLPIFIGTLNYLGTPYNIGYTNNRFAFATIGDGLTDTEAANLYSAVQTFQTTLGRQV